MIGDWCINSSVEEYLNKKYYSIIPYHFNDRNNLYDAYIYCKNIYFATIKLLSNFSNHLLKKLKSSILFTPGKFSGVPFPPQIIATLLFNSILICRIFS